MHTKSYALFSFPILKVTVKESQKKTFFFWIHIFRTGVGEQIACSVVTTMWISCAIMFFFPFQIQTKKCSVCFYQQNGHVTVLYVLLLKYFTGDYFYKLFIHRDNFLLISDITKTETVPTVKLNITSLFWIFLKY